MTSRGSCICSEVKYTFTGEPVQQAICHCLTCRKLTGSTYSTTALVPMDNFTLVSGSENLKSYTVTHESGLEFTYKFCQKCATKIYKTNDVAFKGIYIMQAGTLDDGTGGLGLGDVKPAAELYVAHRVGWLDEMKGLNQAQGFP